MFLHLCHSVHKGGVFAPVHAGIHPRADTTSPGRHHPPPGQTPPPPGQTPPLPSACWDTHTPAPAKCMLGYTPPCPVDARIDIATGADGTHPTGMHSCRKCSLKEAPNYKMFDARQCVYILKY